MRLFDKMKSFGQLLFPWQSLVHANRKIKTKISKIEKGDFESNLDYMKGYESLTLDEVNNFFEKTLQVKKSLEDKLKTSLFSVTLGITVLTSAISFLFNDGVSSFAVMHKGVIVLTGSAAIIYMILAGIFAIKTISGSISVYQPFPEDISGKTDDDRKRLIAICAELNSLSNIIRQNFMSVSFHCIINSLFIVVLFFFVVGGSSFFIKGKTNKLQSVEVTVNPNRSDIELLQNKLISQENKLIEINTNIKDISEKVENNSIAIQNFYKNKAKGSNKTLHTDVDSAPLHPRR